MIENTWNTQTWFVDGKATRALSRHAALRFAAMEAKRHRYDILVELKREALTVECYGVASDGRVWEVKP